MKRFVRSTFITFTALTFMVAGLMLAGCGSGGGSSQDASVGTPLAGQASLTGQASPDPNSAGVNPASATATTAATTAATTTATTTATTSAPVSKQLTLAWDQVAGATSYNLYWSTVPGVTPANGTKISSVSSPYVHTGLAAGTTYYYVVTAANSSSESSASTSASGATIL